MSQQDDNNSSGPPTRGPSFTLTALFVITLVASVMGAAGYYLARGIETGRQRQFTFILFSVAAPALLIVLVSSVVQVLNWLNRRQR
jgi:hypothetical protein